MISNLYRMKIIASNEATIKNPNFQIDDWKGIDKEEQERFLKAIYDDELSHYKFRGYANEEDIKSLITKKVIQDFNSIGGENCKDEILYTFLNQYKNYLLKNNEVGKEIDKLNNVSKDINNMDNYYFELQSKLIQFGNIELYHKRTGDEAKSIEFTDCNGSICTASSYENGELVFYDIKRGLSADELNHFFNLLFIIERKKFPELLWEDFLDIELEYFQGMKEILKLDFTPLISNILRYLKMQRGNVRHLLFDWMFNDSLKSSNFDDWLMNLTNNKEVGKVLGVRSEVSNLQEEIRFLCSNYCDYEEEMYKKDKIGRTIINSVEQLYQEVRELEPNISNEKRNFLNSKVSIIKAFNEYLLHENRVEIAERLKFEFKTEKGKNIRLMIKALEDYNPPLLNVEARQKTAIYNALKLFFNRDIGSKQSVFDFKYIESAHKCDFIAIKSKVRFILENINKEK
jgi:hypothetical protein